MDNLQEFLQNLYMYLIGRKNRRTNIIRIHTRRLQNCGELSFPLDINSWCSLIDKSTIHDDVKTVFEFLRKEKTVKDIVSTSKSWNLVINKCEIIANNAHVYLDRTSTFRFVINDVFSKRSKYGSVPLDETIGETLNICIESDISNGKDNINLSELRLRLLVNTTKNLIAFCDGTVVEDKQEPYNIYINFSLKSSNGPGNCLCGAVLNNKGVKDISTTAEDLYKQRTIHMRLLAEHKYGLRITSQTGWQEFFEKLGEAAVIIELLQNKPSHTLVVDINDQTLTSSKGASFILYNCARIATLLKEFDKKVSADVYSKLPPLEEIDFNLLIQPEEWELLYVYILQFPSVIKKCTRDIFNSKIYPHYLTAMLSAMCLCFSVYYRRIKILTEPRSHMFAALHARIYLLKAIEQVLHNGLSIINIQPVKQM